MLHSLFIQFLDLPHHFDPIGYGFFSCFLLAVQLRPLIPDLACKLLRLRLHDFYVKINGLPLDLICAPVRVILSGESQHFHQTIMPMTQANIFRFFTIEPNTNVKWRQLQFGWKKYEIDAIFVQIQLQIRV